MKNFKINYFFSTASNRYFTFWARAGASSET